MIVSKFGGTSMGDAACMLRSAELAVQQNSYLVCVSATSGTTNQLIELAQLAESSQWDQCAAKIQNLRERHETIAKELGFPITDTDFVKLFDELDSILRGMFLLKECSPKAHDLLLSLGERLSSLLFSQAMKKVSSQKKIILLDARTVIATNDQFGKARPDISSIEKKCTDLILNKYSTDKNVIVTQGFIGATTSGHTTTLGRGGSDYSAALFAEGLNATALEIWTDVPGIATTDPRITSNAKSIKEISFTEASEMAIFGAKVLHPATVEPAMRKNIPVFVGSSFNSQTEGTWVRKDVDSKPLIRALALRKNQTLITISTPEMLQTHGFLYKIFKVFNEQEVSIDAITTSEICVSVTIDGSIKAHAKLVSDLETFADVQIEEGLSLVSLIGNNINHTPGLAKKIFSAIEDINVRMICLGASKHNFCFLVEQSLGEQAINKLHTEFIQ